MRIGCDVRNSCAESVFNNGWHRFDASSHITYIWSFYSKVTSSITHCSKSRKENRHAPLKNWALHECREASVLTASAPETPTWRDRGTVATYSTAGMNGINLRLLATTIAHAFLLGLGLATGISEDCIAITVGE